MRIAKPGVYMRLACAGPPAGALSGWAEGYIDDVMGTDSPRGSMMQIRKLPYGSVAIYTFVVATVLLPLSFLALVFFYRAYEK